MEPLQTDKNGLLPFPLLPPTLPYTAWLTAESAARTEGKGQQMNRRRMMPPLFSSLSADIKVSLERMKLVTILNSLYLAHFLLLYLLPSSLGCHSLQLGKKEMLAPLGDWKSPRCILIHPCLSAVAFQMPSLGHSASGSLENTIYNVTVTWLETLSRR